MKQKVLLFPAYLLLTVATALAQNPPSPPAQADTTPVAPAAAAPAVPPAPTVAPAAPAPATTPPAPEHKPKAVVRKAVVKKRVPLDPPASAVVKSDAVNVRTQPGFGGEVLGHLKKGETVVVQAEITLVHAPKGEPAGWSEIALPADLPVWVDGRFIDSESHTVKARRINLRGGPGENFAIVGRLNKGATVTEIRKRNDWMAIQAPSNAYAYVAAGFLEIQTVSAPPPQPVVNVPPVSAPAPVASTPAPIVPPPTTSEPAPVAPPPTTSEPASAAPPPAPMPAPSPASQGDVDKELAALRQAEATEIPADAPPRIITREGYVHRVYNVQAPSEYELHDIRTDTLIEFLQAPPASDVKLRTFVGTRVSVTGPEFVDHRWPRVPILQAQSINLIP
ncbi:MAG: SH3 domain-containing protein [Limisphaerales bacterium]